MKIEEFHELYKNGASPTIKMSASIVDYGEELDPEMIGKLIGIRFEEEGYFALLVNLSEYEKHNRSVAVYDWRDKDGDLTKCWFDTDYYPSTGVYSFYLPLDIEIPFSIIDESSLSNEYLLEKTELTYVNWLENKVAELRNAEYNKMNGDVNVD